MCFYSLWRNFVSSLELHSNRCLAGFPVTSQCLRGPPGLPIKEDPDENFSIIFQIFNFTDFY